MTSIDQSLLMAKSSNLVQVTVVRRMRHGALGLVRIKIPFRKFDNFLFHGLKVT